MRIRHALGAVLGALMLATVLPGGTASAHPTDESAESWYRLAIVPGSPHGEDRPLDWDKASFATLFCDPDGGINHPDPEQACDDIEEAGSIKDIDKSAGYACPAIFSPVTAFSRGTEPFKETFPNLCVLQVTKGAVFDF